MPTFLVMFRAGDMPCFAPDTLFCSSLFRNDSWVFGLFVSYYSQYVPTAQAQSYFGSLLFLCIFLLKRVSGPRSQAASIPSNVYNQSLDIIPQILFSQKLPLLFQFVYLVNWKLYFFCINYLQFSSTFPVSDNNSLTNSW